uniref:Avr9/Cf-9 rapidly elicited protein n=1 Tax=Lotus japonicus TaxID=34305 RepID=I3ST59_LOTJA|nr:unknown [Lotus japonicus]
MEIEGSQPVVAKKLWNMVRVLFFMLRKGIAKSRVMVDFHHLMLKRGKLAGKAIANTLMFHHQYAALACRSHNTHLSVFSPREYEFSCSNSPVFQPTKRRRHHHHHRYSKPSSQYDDFSTYSAVQKVLEMLNNDKVEVDSSSPLVTLPGFGKSPVCRQLRVTDSPFPLKDESGDSQVDVEVEEFIKRFYKDLNLQKRSMAFFESPSSWVD